ncbi:hypothetical protein [Buchananella felis]|uniref:hypothetical protein n=1 Tax=Buchananella felis TaxID=3231492 RepID=UPI0035272EA4
MRNTDPAQPAESQLAQAEREPSFWTSAEPPAWSAGARSRFLARGGQSAPAHSESF